VGLIDIGEYWTQNGTKRIIFMIVPIILIISKCAHMNMVINIYFLLSPSMQKRKRRQILRKQMEL
jgi:hypothetical protein